MFYNHRDAMPGYALLQHRAESAHRHAAHNLGGDVTVRVLEEALLRILDAPVSMALVTAPVIGFRRHAAHLDHLSRVVLGVEPVVTCEG